MTKRKKVEAKASATDSYGGNYLIGPREVSTTLNLNKLITESIGAGVREIATGKIFTDKSVTLGSVSDNLAQYAFSQKYPSDWGYYWQYYDSYKYVPEVSFAIKLKTRMTWAPGWQIEGNDEKIERKIEAKLRKIRFEPVFRSLTKSGRIMGNGYAEMVTNGDYEWTKDETGQGWHWNVKEPASELYGFKHNDARLMRRIVLPWSYSTELNDLEVERFVQRSYMAGLGIRPNIQLLKQGGRGYSSEISIYPANMIHLRFNRTFDSAYGGSDISESLVAIKGYLIMLQYLPIIFQKRADPLIHVKFGGEITGEMGQRVIIYPNTPEKLEGAKARLQNRAPGEDIYTDHTTDIKEVYRNPNSVRGMDAFLNAWRERILHGLNIPSIGFDSVENTVEQESLINEIQENQRDIEEIVNRQVLPLITSREVYFKFNDLVPEDWMAKARVVIQLYQSGLVNGEFGRYMLQIPEEAGKGAAPISVWGANPTFGPPKLRMKSSNASSKKKSKLNPPKEKGKREELDTLDDYEEEPYEFEGELEDDFDETRKSKPKERLVKVLEKPAQPKVLVPSKRKYKIKKTEDAYEIEAE